MGINGAAPNAAAYRARRGSLGRYLHAGAAKAISRRRAALAGGVYGINICAYRYNAACFSR